MELQEQLLAKQEELNAINAKLNALQKETNELRERGLMTLGALEALQTVSTEQQLTSEPSSDD